MIADPPSFSVVVPTRDRPAALERCLRALVRQEYSLDRFEVVVVDDRSNTDPGPIVSRFGTRPGIRLAKGRGAGPAAARNLGARVADGKILAFTDDDCRPRPGWISTLADTLARRPGAGAGGRTVNVLESNPFSTASQMLIDYLCDYHNEPGEPGSFFTTSNLALPADDFGALGGFSEAFDSPGGEDREFVDRWIRSGRRIVWAPEAIVDHAHPLTLSSFLRQHARYGEGARVFHRLLRRNGRPPPRLEPPRFYRGLIGEPFRAGADRPVLLAALLALSQAATALGYLAVGPPAELRT